MRITQVNCNMQNPTLYQKLISRLLKQLEKEPARYEGILLSRDPAVIDDGQAYGALIDPRPDFVKKDDQDFYRN